MTPDQSLAFIATTACQYYLTASRAGTGVTGLLGLLVATLAKVISTGVDNKSALRYISHRSMQHVGKYLRPGRTQHRSA
jgi:hypothetical protein